MDTIRLCQICRRPLAAGTEDEICPDCLAGAEIANLAANFPQLKILRPLGKGGMGIVYKARQPGLNRFAALKILSPELSGEVAFAERFGREAQALARLNHPGVVQVYDFGRAGDYYYFLMEYVDGMDLRKLMKNQRMTPTQSLELMSQICGALQYAHDEGVVHRDIKPENILLTKKGQAKIADFGIAKLRGRTAESELTSSGVVMGTYDYMAPEQRNDAQKVDHRADIYSLGVLLYEMLTGEVPMGRFDPPSKKVQVDARLDEIVFKALQNEPAKRFQKASEFKTEVESITSLPPTPTPKKFLAQPFLYTYLFAVFLALAFGLRTYGPRLKDLVIKPGTQELVDRAAAQLEQYDVPGHIENAMTDLEEAKQQDPGFTQTQAMLGLAYWRQYKLTSHLEDLKEAERASSRALQLNPDSQYGWFVQGVTAAEEGRLQDATNDLMRANEKFSWGNGEVLVNLALVFWSLNDTNAASSYIKKADEAGEKPWYYYNALGKFHFNQDNDKLAKEDFEQAVHQAPNSPFSWLNLGIVEVALTNTGHAKECIDRFMKLSPSEAAYDALGEFYMHLPGKTTLDKLTAAEAFEHAERLNPHRFYYTGMIGMALIDLPDAKYQEKARAKLATAVEKGRSRLKETYDPVDESIVGLYYAALGDPSNSYSVMSHAMQMGLNNEQVLENLDNAADYLITSYHLSNDATRLRQLTNSVAGNR